MIINIALHPKAKVYLAKYACNKVFGKDTAVREKMSDGHAISRFDRIWSDIIEQYVLAAKISDTLTTETIVKKDNIKQWEYFDSKQEHRIINIENCMFVVQLQKITDEERNLTQLWYLRSSNRDPRTVFVTFNTQEEKDQFDEVALKNRFESSNAFAKKLLLDFLEESLNS